MYEALCSFKVKGADGSIRIVKSGDPVPEAADWLNVQAYINREWIRREGNRPPDVSVTAKTAAPTAPAEDSDKEASGYSKTELIKMSKGDLQILADTSGIDPDQTKAELTEAILSAQ